MRREDLGSCASWRPAACTRGSASRTSSTPTASRCSPTGTPAPKKRCAPEALPTSRLRARELGDRRDRHDHDPGRRGVPARRDPAQNPERSRGPRPARAPDPRPADRPRPAPSRRARAGPDRTAPHRRRNGRADNARGRRRAPNRQGHARGEHVARGRQAARGDPPRRARPDHGRNRAARPKSPACAPHANGRSSEHNIDVHYGVSVPSHGFASVPQAYREAALSLSYTSPSRPIVSLDDLSSLECALIGATATTKAIIASKGNNLRALSDDDLAAAVETIRAFSDADLNVARAAQQMGRPPQHRPLPTRSRSPPKPVTTHAPSPASSSSSASSRSPARAARPPIYRAARASCWASLAR